MAVQKFPSQLAGLTEPETAVALEQLKLVTALLPFGALCFAAICQGSSSRTDLFLVGTASRNVGRLNCW
jgi:hypothetical protein